MLCTDVAPQLCTPFVQDPIDPADATACLESLLALISHARDPQQEGRPLFGMRIMLWIRELRRLVVSIDPEARLRWQADLKTLEEEGSPKQHHMPLAVCRNCGATGWIARKRPFDSQLKVKNLRSVYRAFFDRTPELCLIYPEDPDRTTEDKKTESLQLCLKCLNLCPPTAVALHLQRGHHAAARSSPETAQVHRRGYFSTDPVHLLHEH